MAANASKSVFVWVAITSAAFMPQLLRRAPKPSRRARSRGLAPGHGSLGQRDGFDLDLRAGRKLRDLDRRPRRRRLADALRVDLVHPLEVVEVDEEDRRLDDPVEARACFFQDRLQVVEDLLGLLLDRVADDLGVVGLERELARDEHEPVRADRLRVRRALERRRRPLRPDDLLLHGHSFRGAPAAASAPPNALKIASSTCRASSPWSSRTCSVSSAASESSRRKPETRSRSSPPTCASEKSTFETSSGRPDASSATWASASSAGRLAEP